MNLTITRADLIRAIGHAQRVVERRRTIPILSNLLLTAKGGTLAVKATDLDIEVSTRAAADVATPGSITVPAHLLHDIARKLPEGADVALALGPDGATMTARSGRSRFTLQTLPAHDFPDITSDELPCTFAIPAQDLASAIADTEFAISTEDTRYYLNGIYFHTLKIDGAMRLRAVATDGHRLARAELACPAGVAEGMPFVIVPRKAVGEIAKLVDKATGEVRLALGPNRLRVDVGGDGEAADVTLVTKLIDGTFPDYTRVIPQCNSRRAALDIQALLAATDRVSTISSERGRAVKLAFADGRLTLSVTTPDSGSADEEVEADYDGEPFEIGFNARYLADILGVLIRRGADTVLMKMDSAGSPTILQSRDGADLLTVLMPMRV
jgi:DNA polymerase III subunit beta